MTHRLDDVAGTGLSFGADHGGALADAAQRLTEVHGAAHEGRVELPLVDVVDLIGRGEDLALVDEVDCEGLQDLRLDEVADARLGHHRHGDGLLDLADLGGVRHAGDAALGADVAGHALERHHRTCSGVLGDLRLLGVGDVHDDAPLEGVREAVFHAHGAESSPGRAGGVFRGGGAALIAHLGTSGRLCTSILPQHLAPELSLEGPEDVGVRGEK